MLPDYHFHTDFSGDSQTPMKSQLERAISLWDDLPLCYGPP